MTKSNVSTVGLTALVLSHVILLFTVGDPAATLAPALVAGLATAISAHHHAPQSKIRPRPKIMALACAVLLVATFASFHYASEEADLRLFIARALLADVTAAIIGGFLVVAFRGGSLLS